MPIGVVLAEDSYIVRRGLLSVIAAEPDLSLLAECADFDSLLRAVDATEPDVVVTDIRMPPDHSDEGLRAAAWLRKHHPRVGVVVVSQFVEPDYALALLEHGARGRAYLLKERIYDPDQLLAAVREVAQGGSVIDPRVTQALVEERLRLRCSPLEALSERERQVLSEMAQGKHNQAIAGSLYLSVRAVERHATAIFSKLGLGYETDVHRRVKAVLMFLAEERLGRE